MNVTALSGRLEADRKEALARIRSLDALPDELRAENHDSRRYLCGRYEALKEVVQALRRITPESVDSR